MIRQRIENILRICGAIIVLFFMGIAIGSIIAVAEVRFKWSGKQ